MKNHSLSKAAVDLLNDNGYRIKVSPSKILIKRPYDYIGPFIILFLFSIISLPLFGFSYWLGAFVFALLIVGIYLHRNLVSKASTLKIDLNSLKIELNNKKGKRWFTAWYVREIFIRSNFKGEYTSSFKSTSQEFLVVIGVVLKSGESVDFIHMLSDYKEPNDPMNEIHDFLKSILSKKENR